MADSTLASRAVNFLLSRSPVQAAGRRIVARLDPAMLQSLWPSPQDHDAEPLDDLLAQWLQTDLVVVDVGARFGVVERWRRFAPHVRVVGFEPDEEECRQLSVREGGGGTVSFVPAALGPRSGTATLYLTQVPACSSLYRPVEGLSRQRPELACTALVGTTTVPVTTLDEWLAGSDHDHVDVVKLDTQGSELGVLEGGVRALRQVRLLEVEVEFNEIYERQPLFGDVDRFLREKGFVLWRLRQLVHYGLEDVAPGALSPEESLHDDSRPHRGGQLFWGHAYFVRKELAFPGDQPHEWQQAVRDAVAFSAFGFTDLALSTLRRARAQAPAGCRADLRRLLP